MNHSIHTRRLTAVICSTLLLVVAGVSSALAAGLAQSASKVDVIATHADAASQEVHIRLAIASGWHVNTNPASLDFLVPTSIQATVDGKTVPLKITWPKGHDSGIELGNTAIKVYSDGTVIPVTFDTDTTGTHPTLSIRVQACSNQGLCLPPSTLHVQPRQS